jgi:hypothetical protein
MWLRKRRVEPVLRRAFEQNLGSPEKVFEVRVVYAGSILAFYQLNLHMPHLNKKHIKSESAYPNLLAEL